MQSQSCALTITVHRQLAADYGCKADASSKIMKLKPETVQTSSDYR